LRARACNFGGNILRDCASLGVNARPATAAGTGEGPTAGRVPREWGSAMDPNPHPNPRLKAQAAESSWFVLFACVALLAPPLLAAVLAKRPTAASPAADVSAHDQIVSEGGKSHDVPRAPQPVAGAPTESAVEG